MNTAAIILAAGKSTRMHSKQPKVLHPLMGKPLVYYSLNAVRQAVSTMPVLIIGHQAELVRQEVGDAADYAHQEPQLGTAHAVQQAESLLSEGLDLILVTYADMPLIKPETYQEIIQLQQNSPGPVTMMTITVPDPRGFGRVVRGEDGQVTAIVEEAVATPEQLAIRELNVGVYCFQADWLWQALPRVPLSPKGEYYLTDLVAIAVEDKLPVLTYSLDDHNEAIGINTRVHLAEAEAILRRRINKKWMLAGVTLIDPSTTYIEPGVQIGQDTLIWPNTYLRGDTTVGDNCNLGPNSIIADTRIGKGCRILNSVVESAVLEDDVDVGPYAHLRKGAHLASGVHMGNFGEVKNSYLGPGTKMGHFSYLGDATLGADVNVGAGTITCNYDGVQKNPTEIGAGVFIGSDTMLVAPVKLGDQARTGAGSVVTRDVPEDSLAVGMPARVIRKFTKK